jgi:hypothetical protein
MQTLKGRTMVKPKLIELLPKDKGGFQSPR